MKNKSAFRAPPLLFALCIIIPSAYFVVGAVYSSHFVADDFYISLRYAKNLASGYGIVYNIGEAFPRSEGYTNFFLVLIEAFLFRIGLTSILEPITWVRIISVASVVATLVVVAYYCYQRCKIKELTNRGIAFLVTVTTTTMIATSTPLVFWSVSGFETGLFVALVTAAVALYSLSLSHPKVALVYFANVLFLLATLTRPEGLLFWGGTFLFEIARFGLSRWAGFEGYKWQRKRLYGFVVFGIGIVIYFAWKLNYYGDLLPLTFVAKQAYLRAIADSPYFFVSHRLIGGVTWFIALLTVDYNYLVFMAVTAGALGLWKASAWKPLVERHRASISYASVLLGILSVALLLLYRSQAPEIYGRWSSLYFLFMIQAIGVVFFVVTFLLSVAWQKKLNATLATDSNDFVKYAFRNVQRDTLSSFASRRLTSAPLLYLGLISALYIISVIPNGIVFPYDEAFRLYTPLLPVLALIAFEVMVGFRPSMLTSLSLSLSSCSLEVCS